MKYASSVLQSDGSGRPLYPNYVRMANCKATFVVRVWCNGIATLVFPLQWRHNAHDDVSNHQTHHCLLNRLFRRKSKKTSKLRVTGLCAENSPVTGEFLAQRSSNAENVSIWWRHHDFGYHRFARANLGWGHWKVITSISNNRISLLIHPDGFVKPPFRLGRIIIIASFMGPTWGPSGADKDPDVGPMNVAIWVITLSIKPSLRLLIQCLIWDHFCKGLPGSDQSILNV